MMPAEAAPAQIPSNYGSLEQAILAGANPIQLSGNAPVSSNASPYANVTWLNNVQLELNGFSLIVKNESLGINGPATIQNGNLTILGGASGLGTTNFTNMSAIQITNGGSLTLSNVWINGTTTTPANIVNISSTGTTHTTTFNIDVSGVDITGINIFGNSNTLECFTSTIKTTGFGVNITGQNSDDIQFIANNITAPSGKFVISRNAKGNTITPEFQNNRFQRPDITVYNGTGWYPRGPGVAWFFYNSSQSAGGNMNVTINVSNKIPFTGNVSLLVNTSSISSLSKNGGGSLQNWTNSTLTVVNGNSGGVVLNTTSNVVFWNNEEPVMLGLFYSVGPNTLNINGGSSYEFITLDLPAVIINGNPSGKVPVLNKTFTTNFTEIHDFSNADLWFTIEDPATHKFLAEINFSALNMTDRDVATAIKNLGGSLVRKNGGNRVGFNMSVDTATRRTFNVTATLRTYPRDFTFNSAGRIRLSVVPDDGAASSTLWDGTRWAESAASYVDTTVGLVISTRPQTNQKYIEIHSKHFSSYDTDQSSSPIGGSESNSGGSGSSDSSSNEYSSGGTTGTETTTSVNVGGGSAVTRAEAIGTNLGKDFVITAMPVDILPPSLTPPPAPVYQYISVTTSTIPGTLSQSVLQFSVPQPWLSAHGFRVNDIVMLHNVNGQWQRLETRFVSQDGDSVNYEAITPTFSYFAVAYQQNGTNMSATIRAQPTTTLSTEALSGIITVKTTAAPVPVTTARTQVVPPAQVSPPSEGMPLTTMVIGAISIVVIIAGAVLLHRWWIRRQNPALFRELE